MCSGRSSWCGGVPSCVVGPESVHNSPNTLCKVWLPFWTLGGHAFPDTAGWVNAHVGAGTIRRWVGFIFLCWERDWCFDRFPCVFSDWPLSVCSCVSDFERLQNGSFFMSLFFFSAVTFQSLLLWLDFWFLPAGHFSEFYIVKPLKKDL